MNLHLDLYYSPEVEEALVTLLWHKPELLPRVLRQINPSVHIMQDHLRFILEAIQLSQDLLNATDFATVVQVLKEDGRFEACGELVGLNAIYGRTWDSEIEVANASKILDYYIQLLKIYAAKREARDPGEVVIFSGGKGTINFNKNKTEKREPDYNGAALIRGRKYKVVGWTAQDQESIQCYFYAA
jgi:hypothetical protein